MVRTTLGLLAAGALAIGGCSPADRTNAPAATDAGQPEAGVTSDVARVEVRPRSTAEVARPTGLPQDTRGQGGPCSLQDGKRLDIRPKLASGTEPFWSVRIDGRCVRYATPDNVRGVRVWTRYHADGSREVWSGAVGGRLFELVLEPRSGCSDGMSDQRYPIAASLMVDGQRLAGCAKPIPPTSRP